MTESISSFFVLKSRQARCTFLTAQFYVNKAVATLSSFAFFLLSFFLRFTAVFFSYVSIEI